MGLGPVLWALFAFQLKHFLCDFVLQTKFQVDTKRIYGHFGGFIHSGLHALTTLPIVWLMGASPLVIAAIGVGEFVLHYHVDWLKGNIDIWAGLTERDAMYWTVFGTDQLIHHVTYIGIVAWLAGAL